MEKWLRVFAILASLGLILVMVAIPLNTQAIFVERQSLSAIEVFILLGLAVILILDLLVAGWMGKLLFSGRTSMLNWLTLVMSLGCLVLLVGDKVLLDELGREHLLGAGAGEWIMLYICFAGQMVMNLLVLFRLTTSNLT